MAAPTARQSFNVDVAGLLEALTEQFPEPLLCVRELVQNAADAGSQRIEVDVAYDSGRGLFRLSVRDDGWGMNQEEVEGYLTIGFSDKDAKRQRGRFGVGKLSPYALGLERMVVETCDGDRTHRISFDSDGSGTIARMEPRPRGTVVRVYKRAPREVAEELAERTFALVEETCGSLSIPLFVNGTPVNREVSLPTVYSLNFSSPAGQGVLGVGAESTHVLMGGGIVLETDAPILGAEINYILDSPRLSPTLSRNAVRRDQAFDELVRAARARMPSFVGHVARQLRVRCDRLRADGATVERGLDDNDHAALEWLRSRLLEPDEERPDSVVRDAPVLETADGALVSANELIEVIRREGRVPMSRVPRTPEEIAGYVDRGVPVLLLYRDLEDFLERQGIDTVEVDGLDDGQEIEEVQWTRGEAALAQRAALSASRPRAGMMTKILSLVLIIAGLTAAAWWMNRSSADTAAFGLAATGTAPAPPPLKDASSSLRDPPEKPASARRPTWLTAVGLLAALAALVGVALIVQTLRSPKKPLKTWLRSEVGAPLTVGETRRRRLHVLSRAMFHPIDFLVARGWSVRASGANRTSKGGIQGYRELAQQETVRTGVRLDLDNVCIGFVDLISQAGDANDARILLRRNGRVLLNRNHPTIEELILVAEAEPLRARLLLDVLLATDPELAKATDPRQVEWDLLSRAEQLLRGGRS